MIISGYHFFGVPIHPNEGTHFFSIISKLPSKPWHERFNLYKRIPTELIRLRLGHFITTSYLHRIGFKESPPILQL